MGLVDEVEAPDVANRIKAAPAIRNLYWCDLWADARKPEFWKRRPVVVVSYRNSLAGPCLVVPLTTKAQSGNRWAVPFRHRYLGPETESWAVCNHLLTVSPSRLSSVRGAVPRFTEAEFAPILARVHEWLPKMPTEGHR
ncbi:type II toxin-antitoxin system PemK/MazF family toxin [Aerophototrophica crusticola]|uniref:Type II toxin-antitoxin system PemK/MazF family toxin n=1 Tax=Aerophototrophica crusticola TaxID=1709002 RepID=A0A858R6I2_9PROT|nr:type II toxin-antitoxin system PemK/MazF family toxin [Rhodospirillaceae bacterium B3]